MSLRLKCCTRILWVTRICCFMCFPQNNLPSNQKTFFFSPVPESTSCFLLGYNGYTVLYRLQEYTTLTQCSPQPVWLPSHPTRNPCALSGQTASLWRLFYDLKFVSPHPCMGLTHTPTCHRAAVLGAQECKGGPVQCCHLRVPVWQAG